MSRKPEFEALQSAQITMNVKRARKYDVIYSHYQKLARISFIVGLAFLVPAALLLWFKSYIIGAILVLPSILCFYSAILKGSGSSKALSSLYTEGALTPAIIHRTDPLTIITLVSLSNGATDAPYRYGCREFVVKELPGHTIRKGERIPCSTMFGMSQNPGYFAQFESHPICWATDNTAELQHNIDVMQDPEEWDILAALSEKLPFSHTNMLYILDENYQPLISRHYESESNMEFTITQESKQSFTKRYDGLSKFNSENPDINKLIKLAYENQVAEYFLGFDGEKDKGYSAPFNNSDTASVIDKFNASLQSGEVVFAVDEAIVTNKGVWDKKGFTPWRDVTISMEIYSGSLVHTYFNKKRLCCFDFYYDLYPVEKDQQDELVSLLKALETEHLTNFWLDVKRTFGS